MRLTRHAILATTLATGAGLMLTGPATGITVAGDSTTPTTQQSATYRVTGDVATIREAVSRSGADVEGPIRDSATVTVSPAEAAVIRSYGLTLTPTVSSADLANKRVQDVRTRRTQSGQQGIVAGDFPPGDEAYHTYAEMVSVLDSTVARYPDLASKRSIGKSAEGRDLWMLRLGKGAEGSPEVVFTCNQHAREHLTTEQCLDTINQLTSGYASNSRIKNVMDNRVIWIMPVMNPDGSSYDITGGKYQNWRKNRTRNSDGSIGIDPNRNWGYKWGCCNGSSGTPSSATYRGPSAFAAPEPRAVADFLKSREINGEQRVKAYMDVHTFSELIMWPFGHTKSQVTDRMTRDQYDMHVALGRKLQSNGYSASQSSDLYITDGDSMDYVWGALQIPTIGIEMYPKSGGGGFYPPASVIGREVARNREAMLTYMELADCQYRLIGKQDQYCKQKPTPTPTSTTTPAPTPTVTPTETPTPTPTQTTPTPTPTTPTPTTTAPKPPVPGGNVVVNGGFESGQSGWSAWSGTITTDAARAAHSGSGKLWLGGYGYTAKDAAEQRITVPANAKLTFWMSIDTYETSTTTKFDTSEISVNGTVVASFSNLDKTNGYVQKTVDLSAYAGQTVTLKLASSEDTLAQTSFVYDDISVQ